MKQTKNKNVKGGRVYDDVMNCGNKECLWMTFYAVM